MTGARGYLNRQMSAALVRGSGPLGAPDACGRVVAVMRIPAVLPDVTTKTSADMPPAGLG